MRLVGEGIVNGLAAGGIGLILGFAAALEILSSAQGASPLPSDGGVVPSSTSPRSSKPPGPDLDRFADAFERVQANYVREVENSELINGAIKGMVSSLDPHSSYMDPKEFQDVQTMPPAGAGLEITSERGRIRVVRPILDSPAARAGIRTGDYIIAFDGMSALGIELYDAISKLRGEGGSKVTLTIVREGKARPFDVAVTRAIVRVANVEFRREGDLGYLRIQQFISEHAAADVAAAMRQLKSQIGPGIKGYIVDLRDNPGGLLDQCIAVADDFLDEGEISTLRGRHPNANQDYKAHGGDMADGKPITVLINAVTASGAEIVAGALQDNHRATVIGMRSFGMGTVQTIIPVGRGGALRLTTSRFFTPFGRAIQLNGITPDIAVSQLPARNDTGVNFQRSEARLPGHMGEDGDQAIVRMGPVVRPEPGKSYDDFQLTFAIARMNGRSMPGTDTVSAH